MLDTRYDSVVYQSQVYVSALVDELVQAKKKIGKEKDAQWAKVDRIYAYLEALQETPKLTDATDITNITFILECLIVLCEIASFPIVPSLMWTGTPNLLVGIPGPPGTPGATGARGATGLATDFSYISTSITVIVDSFPITSAKAARWDYVVREAGGAMRASSIIGEWTPDGVSFDLIDNGAEDLVSSTTGIEFDISVSGASVQLIAVISSGTWSIWGSRYFIPNNGNGSGPITNVLPLGQIYIGNASNQTQAQSISGVISITPSGVTSYAAGSVVDTTISNSANITLSKLASLNNNIIVITDGGGKLTSSTLSPTTLGYVDIGSSLTALLAAKLTDPLTTVGDLLIRNGLNVTAKLGIGLANQVLTVVGGLPAWTNLPGGITGLTTGFLPKASSTTTLANSIISESSGAITLAGTLDAQGGIKEVNGTFLKKKVISLGVWDIYGHGQIISSFSHGLTESKIRAVSVMICDNSGHGYELEYDFGTSSGGRWQTTATDIQITIIANGYFANTSAFGGTGINRGYITIEYQA